MHRVASLHGDHYKCNENEPAWYTRKMSQALCYAMHAKNGWVIVTTRNEAMVMMVDPVRTNGTWKLKGKVSRISTCNDHNRSSFHAVIAILRESIEEDANDFVKGCAQFQRCRLSRSASTHSSSSSPRRRRAHTPAITTNVDVSGS